MSDQGCGELAEFLGVEGDWLTKSVLFEFVSVPFPQAPPGSRSIELFADGAFTVPPSGHVPFP